MNDFYPNRSILFWFLTNTPMRLLVNAHVRTCISNFCSTLSHAVVVNKMEFPGGKKHHFRHLLFFAFHRGVKAVDAARDICVVYGDDVISVNTAQKWFSRFSKGNFDLHDIPRSGRPATFDEERLRALLREDASQTCRQLAAKMNCDAMTISRHLKSMGYIKRVWKPNRKKNK